MQQINLLPSKLLSTQKQFTAKKVSVALLVVISILTVVTWIQWWVLSSNENEKKIALQTQQEVLLEIKLITAKINKFSDDSKLKRILVNKELELKNKQNVLRVLSESHFGNTKGFADHMAGLSRQHIEGLWITNFNIHDGGKKLSLQGSTFEPEHVPKYLLKLSHEVSFSGVEFKTFHMQRHLDTNRIDFDIRSNIKEAS